MKKWNRTTFDWVKLMSAVGFDTNIRVTDWEDERVLYHRIHGLRIFSLPVPTWATLLLDIRRCMISPTDRRAEITRRLEGIGHGLRKAVVVSKEYSMFFETSFILFPGEEFCEGALVVAEEVFSRFGVQDKGRFKLASFSVHQETFVRFERRWIDFAGYLRLRNGLPEVENVEEASYNRAWVSPGEKG